MLFLKILYAKYVDSQNVQRNLYQFEQISAFNHKKQIARIQQMHLTCLTFRLDLIEHYTPFEYAPSTIK